MSVLHNRRFYCIIYLLCSGPIGRAVSRDPNPAP